ncbi:MAG: hypothetical protein ACI4L9_04580 [Candidatus Coproplasma sp.]
MKLRITLLSAALVFFAAAFIARPERYVPVCFEGIALWAECVLPSLFPFMVITLILVKTGAAQAASRPFARAAGIFGLPPVASAVFLMSVCSGYPAGSRIVCEYCECGALNAGDAKKMAALCSTSGPLFIIGSVGYKMFADKRVGLIIYAAHVVSVAIIGAGYCLLCKRDYSPRGNMQNFKGNILYDSFYSAVISVIVAGGFICFFYTLSAVIADVKLLYPLEFALNLIFGEGAAGAVCLGLCEATGGCAALAACLSPYALPLAGFLITFGGISIIAQQLCYLTRCGVKCGGFIAVKFLQGLLCFLLLLPLSITA